MIVLDTSILVYAKGHEHRLRQPCRDLIAAIAEDSVQATTSVEVIQEYIHVRAKRCGRRDATATGWYYAELLSPLLSTTQEHLRHGLTLFERVDNEKHKLGAFDAVLIAAAAAAGATAVVSADTAFGDRRIEDLLSVVHPDSIERLLDH